MKELYPGCQALVNFMQARYIIYRKRCEGIEKPWSKDPIFQQYRFCNIFRESDKVTTWIANNWRQPNASDPDLWFAMVVARLINWPNTLERIGYPVPWNRSEFLDCITRLREPNDTAKVYTGAYMVRSDKMPKHEYLANILDEMWGARKELRPQRDDLLYEFYTKLVGCRGLGSFMAAQVVADMKYVPVMGHSVDWWTFAASGPGSRRGLNRVMNKPLTAPWKEPSWHANLIALKAKVHDRWGGLVMHAQDLQNCLCEFDKYERVRLGQGTPKQRYPGV